MVETFIMVALNVFDDSQTDHQCHTQKNWPRNTATGLPWVQKPLDNAGVSTP